MTQAFVADAPVAIGWVHPAQATSETKAMLDAIEAGAVLEVPALWPLEVANVLTVLVRRRKLAEEDRRPRWVGYEPCPSELITKWRRWRFQSCRSWRRLADCPSTMRPTSSSQKDGRLRWPAKTVL